MVWQGRHAERWRRLRTGGTRHRGVGRSAAEVESFAGGDVTAMKRVLGLAFCCCAATASAQSERVRIAPLPLKTATGDPKLDEALARKFEMKLLGSRLVEVPLPDKIQEFLRSRAGAPC